MTSDADSNDENDDTGSLNGLDELAAEIAEEGTGKNAGLQAQLEEQKKQNLYLRADFDNYRKQSIRERTELLKYGSEPLLREFLNVYDDLQRAAATELTADTMGKYKNGVDMIVSQFKKTLEKFGVEEFEALNQKFDPLMHEALTSENNPDLPPDAITQVFKRGFKLNGKVIRPAQVVVNTAGSAEKKD